MLQVFTWVSLQHTRVPAALLAVLRWLEAADAGTRHAATWQSMPRISCVQVLAEMPRWDLDFALCCSRMLGPHPPPAALFPLCGDERAI